MFHHHHADPEFSTYNEKSVLSRRLTCWDLSSPQAISGICIYNPSLKEAGKMVGSLYCSRKYPSPLLCSIFTRARPDEKLSTATQFSFSSVQKNLCGLVGDELFFTLPPLSLTLQASHNSIAISKENFLTCCIP